MKEIALRYCSTKLSDLTYDDAAADQLQFSALKVSDPIYNTVEEKGTMLNGRKFNHLLYKHCEFELVISADEIDENVFQFLQSFWSAPFKYISFYDGGYEAFRAYIQVMTEGGAFPLSYVGDVKDFKEVNFKLSYAVPL